VIFFCPKHGEWFEDFTYNFQYNNYWPRSNIQNRIEDQTIIDIWNTVPIPPAPKLKSVLVNKKNTAQLILDMDTTICKNPRCITSISNIKTLLTKSRKEGIPIIYSLIPTGNSSDIDRKISPSPGDPIVKSSVDKFYKTNLEKILQEKGIKTVIVTGYAANGAVLHTATSAAFRGFNVIIPVDCMSADNPYAEQYTAWHMLNSPGTKNRVTLTKVNLISFQT
jgi:nicotinamidase-related amidase